MGGEDERAGEAAVWGVRGEEILHLRHGGAAAEAAQAADELDEPQVAGGQRVGVAPAVKADALDRPGADLADREQAGVVRGVGRINATGRWLRDN